MPQFHTLTISEVRKETEDTVSIAFDVPQSLKDDYQFIQGQYLTLRADINGEDVRRSYSICSGTDEGELRVAIKQVEDGRFSTYANNELKAGDELSVMTPMGNFYVPLDETNDKDYLAFAAGSGITPMMSIIKTTLQKEPNSTFTLFYANRSSSTIIFRDELEELKDRYLSRLRIFHVLTQEPTDIPMFSGRIDADKCGQFCDVLVDAPAIDAVFICGPEPMIKAVSSKMEELGTPKENIHFELFTSPVAGALKEKKATEKKPEFDGKTASVEVVLDGNTLAFNLPYEGENILDAALGKGADLPFSCKGGVCCTCRALLVEGEVDMEVNYSLEPDEVERGFILTCQAHPRTEKVVVDFDQQ
ncbi:1,2-phenylacetyl-CoA epoxidase subunit PaaE [Sanyastnella coralliicola]|uniref:1,2-phenylacetyl-CoA epoxidase subunit PaaE n=1 Tax=Sanyastnella coralliicola TaxID=3069118 RepID=UPI0027BA863C|nr:1,2-phenylacetyl-CoA epoxidase subunit PaaE [Longitalea sp. SCSIO 12813]